MAQYRDPAKPLKELLDDLPVTAPQVIPRSQASRQLEDPKNILSEDEIKQIQAYSHIFSSHLRAIERHHVENLFRAAYSPSAIQDARSRVGTINLSQPRKSRPFGGAYSGTQTLNITISMIETIIGPARQPHHAPSAAR